MDDKDKQELADAFEVIGSRFANLDDRLQVIEKLLKLDGEK